MTGSIYEEVIEEATLDLEDDYWVAFVDVADYLNKTNITKSDQREILLIIITIFNFR